MLMEINIGIYKVKNIPKKSLKRRRLIIVQVKLWILTVRSIN
jgi:hypothetical protein